MTISLLAFELPDKKRLFAMRSSFHMPAITDTVLPATLSDGQSAQLFMSYRDIGEALRSIGIRDAKIFPVCEDSTGAKYRGDAWTADSEELIKM